jgi:hypothetical protein
MGFIQPVSKMRELLPLLGDEGGEQKFLKAIQEINDLTVKDAKSHIADLRGISKNFDEAGPAIFKARVRYGELYNRVDVVCQDGVDYYAVGALTIKKHHWARWEERFGGFVEVVDEQNQ